jgi:hypothetical protein
MMRKRLFLLFIVGLAWVGWPGLFQAQTSGSKVSYITYEEARPTLEILSEIIPAELRSTNAQGFARWAARRDAEIRARLVQGDEDSLINFLLFGTSFTRAQRVTLNALTQLGGKLFSPSQSVSPEADVYVKAIKLRAEDLARAMAAPGTNERLLFARQLVESKGFEVKTAAGRERAKQYLYDNLNRVLNEAGTYARILQSARLLGDPSAEFAEKSKLYSSRGLSSDTSLLPNFAIEKALNSLMAQKLFAPGSVRRVAVIGPGLDFTDKQDGYDFYTQQTIQPFAIIDSLLRLGLSRGKDLTVTTFDLSPRINTHLARARARALRGISYVVQLPRDGAARWTTEAIEYWSKFGDRIAVPVQPVRVPAVVGDLKVRAVRIRPDVVSLITPRDVNIVLQRLDVREGEGFDLIIATNILVYYDVFEQNLALANIEKMLRPGGFLLSNNALLELPSSQIRSVGYESVAYSDRPDDGDHIVWYQRAPAQ